MEPVTRKQVVAAFQMIATVGQLIRELKQVPAGELYARLMPAGITLEQFESIISKLVSARLVTRKNHLLTWVEPKEATDGKM